MSDRPAGDPSAASDDTDDTDEGEGRGRATVVRWVVGAVVVLGVIAFLALGANRPADPHLLPHSARPQVPGFGEIAFRIDTAGDSERCALLADNDAQHQQGLMNRTDLAGHDGMLFRFKSQSQTGFYMKDTPMPLSIAWFDADGNFVSSTDMEPCLERIDCPNHYAKSPYRYALEVQKGGLADLGIGPGSHISVGGTCS